MINSRVPLNFQKHLRMVFQYKSCSSSDKDSKNTIEIVDNREKIMTEKFRILRPYIQERDVKLEGKIFSIIETQQGPWTNEVTNVSGTQLEEEKLLAKEQSIKDNTSSSTKDNNKDGQKILNCSSPPLVTNDEKDSMIQSDLSMIGLPLTLHHKDENLLVAAVVQDLEQIFIQTTDMADRYYLLVHQYGLLWYTALKMTFQDPSQIKNFVLSKNVNFSIITNKSNIWLTEDKPESSPATPAANKNKVEPDKGQSESTIDKILKNIQDLIDTLKKKVEEKKKSMSEKENEKK